MRGGNRKEGKEGKEGEERESERGGSRWKRWEEGDVIEKKGRREWEKEGR